MKNLVKLFAVVLVLGITVTSCEKEDSIIIKSDIVSLNASFSSNSDIAKASKSGPQRSSSNLNRGTIPTCVRVIDVRAVSGAGDIEHSFNIINSTDESTATALIQAHLGWNKFIAITPCTSWPIPVDSKLVGKTVEEVRLYLKSLRPYVEFRDIMDQTITEAKEPLTFNMTTTNGRMLMVFNPEAEIMNYYNLKVFVSAKNKSSEAQTVKEIMITSTDAVKYFYWSDYKCVGGKTLSLTVKFFAKSDSNCETVLKTLSQNSTQNSDLLVVDGESHNMKVNISKSNIIVESIPSTFTFNPIVDSDSDVNM